MNNVIKTGLLTQLIFAVIASGLFGISTASVIDDIFAEIDKQGKTSNTEGITTTSSSSKNGSEKCSPWDPRDC